MFAERLNEQRERSGLKQVELANAIGVTRSYINQLESGIKPPPAGAILKYAADLLNCSVDYLLRRTDKVELEK